MDKPSVQLRFTSQTILSFWSFFSSLVALFVDCIALLNAVVECHPFWSPAANVKYKWWVDNKPLFGPVVVLAPKLLRTMITTIPSSTTIGVVSSKLPNKNTKAMTASNIFSRK